METIHYPRSVPPTDVFTQETLDRLTSFIFSWQQGPGTFGGLHLHACWSDFSALTRKYQGQTTFLSYLLMRGFIKLFDKTKDIFWRNQASDLTVNLLFLCKNGGFSHADFQEEPAYANTMTCPIHQGTPLLALLDYYEWEHADSQIKERIRPAIDKHWEWFQKLFWMKGNKGLKSMLMPHPEWCGVTNQDLVIVAALARQAKVFGDSSRYEQFGLPTLNAYLAPDRYYAHSGLLERGDNPNFVERTFYYTIILDMLDLIHQSVGDSRLPDVINNISSHLFDAAFMGEDGRMHLAWGADTERTKGVPSHWIHSPVTFSKFPLLLQWMRRAEHRNLNSSNETVLQALMSTLADYTFQDGTIPVALGAVDPIYKVIGATIPYWIFLIDCLGETVKSPSRTELVSVNRRCGDLLWKNDEEFWCIEKQGLLVFEGFKADPSGIALNGEPFLYGKNFGEQYHRHFDAVGNQDFMELL